MTEEIKEYLDARQADALLIESLMSAATVCVGTGRDELLYSLIEAAGDAAKALGSALDTVNLPEGCVA